MGPGGTGSTLFASPVDFVFLHKDIAVGVGGFISDFSNSHSLDTVPEPATLLLFGTTLTGGAEQAHRFIHERRDVLARSLMRLEVSSNLTW